MTAALRHLVALVVLTCATLCPAAEVMPPAPTRYFNDYAGMVRAETASTLNAELEQFEKDTSNQIVVALFPRMQSNSSVEDYTVRVAQSWRVGRKGLNNGAVLFVFAEQRQVYIQVGYGLEPKLTDLTSNRIIENEIVPRFRQNDFDGGIAAGARAMMAAAKGEYLGTGRTIAQASGGGGPGGPGIGGIIFIILIVILMFRSRRLDRVFGGRRRGFPMIPPMIGGGGFGRGGGGGWGGGGGGGFSGGGGSFGGGGAGGRW